MMGEHLVGAASASTVATVGSDRDRPLVADRARGPAIAVIVSACAVVAVLSIRYADQHTAGRLDLLLDGYIRRRILRDDPLVVALVGLGSPAQAAYLVAAVAGVGAVARRWSSVLLTVGGTFTAVVISEVILKPLVGRLSYGHLSFPSGHSTAVTSVAVASVIMLSTARRPRSIALRLAASLAAVAVAASVAVALVAEHAHYATDTIAGCGVAVATMPTLALVLDSCAARLRSRHCPPPR